MNSTATQVIEKLQSHKIKAAGTNRYRFNSPFRTGADGMTCSLVIHDGEHGAWMDHKEQCGGGLYDLAKRLGIEPPTTAPNGHHEQRYANLAEYAKAHGVEFSVFETAGWRDTTYNRKPAIEIPTPNGKRWRMLEGDAKYLNPKGYTACWYGLNAVIMKALGGGCPIVYANGEASAVVARHFGIPAITVAGGGEKTIPSDLLAELQDFVAPIDATIIVALDCDPKGMQAAQQVVEQLQGIGITARAVDLNLWSKGDLADFCKLHREESYEALQSLPPITAQAIETKQAQYQRWRVITEDEMWKLPPLSYLLEPFIPDGMVGVLYGQSNIGKSFIALDFAMQLSRENPVTYMIAEGFEGYPARIAAWRKHYQCPQSNITYIKGGVRILEDEDFQAFLPVLEKHKPRFLVVDTVKKTIVGRNSSDEKDVGLYLARCYEIKDRLGCTVLLVHHTNKGGQNMTGSYSWTSDVDFVIQASDDDGLIALESNKDKNNAKFKAHYRQIIPVRVEKDGMVYDGAVVVPAEREQQTETSPLTRLQERVLGVMTLSIYENGCKWSDLRENLQDVGTSSLSRAVSRLKELGFIEQVRKYAAYQITEQGQVKLTGKSSTSSTSSTSSHDNKKVTTPPPVKTGETSGTSGTLSQIDDENGNFEDYAASLGLKVLELPDMPEVNKRPPSQYDEGF